MMESDLLSFLFPPQYLAILFFQKDYKSYLDNLDGVEDDEKELTGALKNYQKRVVRNSEDVLKGLRKILQDFKQKEFKRIHFHFSGRIYLTRKKLSSPSPKSQSLTQLLKPKGSIYGGWQDNKIF